MLVVYMLSATLTGLLMFSPVNTYPSYKNDIPNGDKVPNPCKPGEFWEGIGHTNPAGAGARNPFGKDWEKQKYWLGVCHLDSDEDGRTNGEELGDPRCEFSPFSGGIDSTNITHPGICEPMDSDHCRLKNAWLKCGVPEKCQSIGNPDVKVIPIHLQAESVPVRETTYICKIFSLPTGDDAYDVIAAEPLIGNSVVLHHMVLYGCDDNDPKANSSRESFECFMTENSGCTAMISAFARWDTGVEAFCLPPDVGVRIGKGGYTKLMIQYHWTNFDLLEGQKDSSGIRLFYTPKLRANTAGMLLVGQTYLEIPPHKTRTTFSGGCASDCTLRRIQKRVKIIELFHHMHYLGTEQSVEVFRNGVMVRQLSRQLNYDYNSPVVFRFEDPFELLPGDYVRTTCTFDSTTQNRTVFFGPGSANEMCFAFLRFYPLSNLPLQEGGCSEWKSIPLCKVYTGLTYVIDGCNPKHFLNPSNKDRIRMFNDAARNCRAFHTCLPECQPIRTEVMSHPCLNTDIGDLIKIELAKSYDGAMFLARLDSCKAVYNESSNTNDDDTMNDSDGEDDGEGGGEDGDRNNGVDGDKTNNTQDCGKKMFLTGHAENIRSHPQTVFVGIVIALSWLGNELF